MFYNHKSITSNKTALKSSIIAIVVGITIGMVPLTLTAQTTATFNAISESGPNMKTGDHPVTLAYLHSPALDERKPEFVNGSRSFLSTIEYPYEARYNGVEGQVILQFIIDESGRVISPRVIQGIGSGCDEAAINALLKTKFKPGMQNGQSVATLCELPITFKLSTLSHIH